MLKVNVEALPFRNTLLSYFLTEDLRGKPKPTYTPIKVSDRKYNPKFIKALQQEANYKTWDNYVRPIIYRLFIKERVR